MLPSKATPPKNVISSQAIVIGLPILVDDSGYVQWVGGRVCAGCWAVGKPSNHFRLKRMDRIIFADLSCFLS